jgi:DNA polymerase elongation subunit (family B)
LDFEGLYPSVMMARGLCVTTHLTEAQARQLNPRDVYACKTDAGMVYFIRSSVFTGFLPAILNSLKKKRAEAKEQLEVAKKAGNKPLADMLNMRQNNLKLAGNSTYGTVGSPTSSISDPAIARTVTADGRDGIDTTCRVLMNPFHEIPRMLDEIVYPDASEDEISQRNKAYETRCREARATYPLERLPGESDADLLKRITATLDIVYGDTLSELSVAFGSSLYRIA